MFTDLASKGLWLILVLSLLPLLASLIVGLVISLFQALTQIQEQTLTFVPKIIATILVIMITAGWMMDNLREFATQAFDLMLKVSVMR
ncbi:MAG TPA: flagellar biosynthesis protein FliQ [Pyrinomonadaceae bacterium]|nr:flagellar biosynthesis protein FliQ [Pyrinomonadaceae bacterium]